MCLKNIMLLSFYLCLNIMREEGTDPMTLSPVYVTALRKKNIYRCL